MKSHQGESYPIRDYALIGDCHSAALVANNGSIDWCCWPQIDSPAIFCRLLDARKGGFFQVEPAGKYAVSRSYMEATNILVTTFKSESGELRLTDFMPIQCSDTKPQDQLDRTRHRILRRIEGTAGNVELMVRFRPTFDYARANTNLAPFPNGAVACAGAESLSLICPAVLAFETAGLLSGRMQVTAGKRFWIELTYQRMLEPECDTIQISNAEDELARTIDYWQTWSAACTYTGPYHGLVQRSALALKLLTFSPTGALVAAPTTSLPEEIGGVRNWDYRYTWLRESSLILYALQTLGYHVEAIQFWGYLERLCIGGPCSIQPMYTARPSSHLPEQTLDHLEGYRQSQPVRIGNAAASQKQIDIYGHLLDAAYFCFRRMPRPLHPELWSLLEYLANQAATSWCESDHGVWEVRDQPQHFLYSKLLCWVAVDRAIRLGKRAGNLADDLTAWRSARKAIRHAILSEGYNKKLGAFTQVFGGMALDASVLAIPIVGFLPATDARVRSTMQRIQERLTSHGLVHRYVTGDGLPGGEGTFLLCTFWLVDNLALSGQVAQARQLFERVTKYANDVGLLSEEVDPTSGELLGNYPQGFTHMVLIRSALHIATAEAFGAEQPPTNSARRAEDAERGVRK